jgi:hypothetical protein
MFRTLTATLALILSASAAWAGIDPETAKPYQLRVVLHIAKHRLLTKVFNDRVRLELRDSLQAALGDLAQVEVVPVAPDNPQIAPILANGLKQTLDGWNFVDGIKHHFVLIDFVNGQYALQSRQYDGTAGLSSPVVRHSVIADPQLVARQAALLVSQDFGVVGTLLNPTTDPKGETVEVTLKGGGLGTSLAGWLNKDDVFAVTQIMRQGNAGERASQLDGTLLQVTEAPHGAVCRCRLYHRYGQPFRAYAGFVGFRCLRLGTIQAPVRLRVVAEDKVATPLNGKQVTFAQHGFNDTSQEGKSTNPDGFVESNQSFSNLAFVRILDAGQPLANVPVAITSDLPVTIAVPNQRGNEQLGQLNLQRNRWTQQIYETLQDAATLFKELNDKAWESRDKTMEQAQAGLKNLQETYASLATAREDLRRQAEELPKGAAAVNLAEGSRGLEELKSRIEQLEKYITDLRAIADHEKDPAVQKLKEDAKRAQFLESQAEFGQAIDLYKQILKEGGDDPAVRQRLETLEKQWKIKSEEHQQARQFFYELWPNLDTASKLKSKLGQAKKYFEVCRTVGDVLTPLRFVKANQTHAAQLGKEYDAHKGAETDEDVRTLNTIDVVTKELQKLNDEVVKYLQTAKPAAK